MTAGGREKVREDFKHLDALIPEIGYLLEKRSLGSVPGQMRPSQVFLKHMSE